MLARENLIVVRGQIFHFKLGCFYVVKEAHDANECPCIKLKIQSKFCPASFLCSFLLPSMEGGQCPLSLPQVPFCQYLCPYLHVNQRDRFP